MKNAKQENVFRAQLVHEAISSPVKHVVRRARRKGLANLWKPAEILDCTPEELHESVSRVRTPPDEVIHGVDQVGFRGIIEVNRNHAGGR